MLTHSISFFTVTERISDWYHSAGESACSQLCTGGSVCWNYVTDTFYGNYSGDKVCCIFASFEVVLFVTSMLVDLSAAIKQVTVSVAIMQLEVSAAHMKVTVSATKM